QRLREQKALSEVTARRSQQFILGTRLDALGHDLEAELVRQQDDGLAKGQIRALRAQVRYKGLIDLEVVDGELAQVGQRGIARAKIVERDLDAGVMEGGDLLVDAHRRIKQATLGDLDDHGCAFQTQAIEMLKPMAEIDSLVAELHRRDIHAE